MFFEGSEKKAEIIIDSSKFSLLRDLDEAFWAQMVSRCDAQILSSVVNDKCKAFLLSESSLFVWEDRLVILTCGQTRLVMAVDYFLTNVDKSIVLQTVYQRKNEHLAYAQHTSFLDDTQVLDKHMSSQVYLFGDMHGHHQYLHHLDNDYKADVSDKTYELLVYQISDEASKMLTTEGLSKEVIRGFFRLNEIIPGFAIDDFVFEPFGYSLNAIKDDYYFTIHVTPQSISSYVSFESNLNLIDMLGHILSVLSPLSFDLVSYNELEFQQQAASQVPHNFVCKRIVEGDLKNGYRVNFANYILPQETVVAPVKLNLSGDKHVF